MKKLKFFNNIISIGLIFSSIAGFSQRKISFIPLDSNLTIYQNNEKTKINTSFKADQAPDQNGKPSRALAFNGNNTYGQLSYPPPLNNFTIAIWIKPEDIGTSIKQTIISAAYQIGKDPCNIYIQNNQLVFKVEETDVVGGTLKVQLQSNDWHHIVAVRRSDRLNLYVNGEMEIESINNFARPFNGNPNFILLGANRVLKATKELTMASDNNFITNFFKGTLSDLVIVNEALEEDEIVDLFEKGQSNLLPKGYYDKKTTQPPVSQANITQPSQSPTANNLPSGGNTSLNFDGIKDYVELPANVGNFTNNQPFTVACWVKANAVQNKQFGVYSDNDIIEKWDGNNKTGYPFAIRYMNNAAGKNEGKVAVMRYDGNTQPQLISNTKINDGRWHYITMVKSVNPFIIKLYIDGNLEGWINDTCNGVTTNNSGLYLGARGNKINFFNGEIDNIRIWSIDKTIEEIKAEMEDLQPKIENLVAAYNFDDGLPAEDNTNITMVRDYLGKNNGKLYNFTKKSSTSNFVKSTAIAIDNNPPQLKILSPVNFTNGIKTVFEENYPIAGILTDESGVESVTVNNSKVEFDKESGVFHAELKIPFGDSQVTILAFDKKQNKLEYKFLLKRPIPEVSFGDNIVMTNEKRYALVIGNNDYKKTTVLKNPVNDAILMSNELRSLGFEVDTVLNGNRSKMFDAIDHFTDKLRHDSTSTGLFYFAGHGMQVKGNNFLIPIDADIKSELNLERDCIQLNSLLGTLKETGNNMNIIILDACRNNPFPDPKKLARGDKIGGGLADIKRLAKGTFIAFATAPGDVALDGVGKNSKYTEELVKAMRTPKLPIEEVFKTVKAEVLKASNDEQQPWESSQLVGKFYFKVK